MISVYQKFCVLQVVPGTLLNLRHTGRGCCLHSLLDNPPSLQAVLRPRLDGTVILRIGQKGDRRTVGHHTFHHLAVHPCRYVLEAEARDPPKVALLFQKKMLY